MKITTRNGYTFTIDDEDFPKLGKYHWLGKPNFATLKNGERKQYTTYIVRSFHRGRQCSTIRLHRVIMDAPKGIEVDHIDGNGLNNCKSNLRLCTRMQNSQNQKMFSTNKSGFKGVYQVPNGKWASFIVVNKKQNHLGTFLTKEAAAAAYNDAAVYYFKEFAKPNKIGR